MANVKKRLPGNVPGNFFVDSTCINCDTCRQLAPSVFEDDGDYSYVKHQPEGSNEEREAFRALLACPTSSIGTEGKNKAREVMEDFPLLMEDPVYYLGFNAESSFGGNSYFIKHPHGNWMVDAPRFLPFLAKKLESLGGVRYIFFTHRDDVAGGDKYAEKFGAERIIHKRDLSAIPEAEKVLTGTDPIEFSKDFLIIPTPGHTRGHCVLLYKNKFMLSGDHLWWSRRTKRLGASKRVAWYSWKEQVKSMEKLLDYSFDWVLPGHGRRIHQDRKKMHTQLTELVDDMKTY